MLSLQENNLIYTNQKLHPKDVVLDDSDGFDESVGYVIDEIDDYGGVGGFVEIDW